MTSTSTISLDIGPRKGKDFCKTNGIEHAYQPGPTLTVDPPIQTRDCKNCGHKQWLRPSHWEDAP